MDEVEFENLIKEIKRKFGEGFTKELRQMPEGEFAKAIIDSMEQLMFLKRIKANSLCFLQRSENWQESIQKSMKSN